MTTLYFWFIGVRLWYEFYAEVAPDDFYVSDSDDDIAQIKSLEAQKKVKLTPQEKKIWREKRRAAEIKRRKSCCYKTKTVICP